MAVTLTAAELTCQRLPDCISQRGLRTTSYAIHRDKIYTGNLRVWENFESEVRKSFQEANVQTSSEPLGYSDEGLDPECNLFREYYRCGEEISVSGRFVQNALQVISGVGKAIGYQSIYGDWKASVTSKGVRPLDEINYQVLESVPPDIIPHDWLIDEALAHLVPDYCVIDEDDNARAVGEAKVPWKHKFASWWQLYQQGNEELLRKVLGQVAYYMQNAKVKYGFLTNYDLTFFLKQVRVGDAIFLFCSRPIPHTSVGSEATISVRQCLLYLLMRADDDRDWFFDNESETWVLKRLLDEKIDQFRDRIEKAREKERVLGHSESENEEDGLSTRLTNLNIRDNKRPATPETTEPRKLTRAVPIEEKAITPPSMKKVAYTTRMRIQGYALNFREKRRAKKNRRRGR